MPASRPLAGSFRLRFFILCDAKLPGGLQSTAQHILIGIGQADVSHPHAAPAAADGNKKIRVLRRRSPLAIQVRASGCRSLPYARPGWRKFCRPPGNRPTPCASPPLPLPDLKQSGENQPRSSQIPFCSKSSKKQVLRCAQDDNPLITTPLRQLHDDNCEATTPRRKVHKDWRKLNSPCHLFAAR